MVQFQNELDQVIFHKQSWVNKKQSDFLRTFIKFSHFLRSIDNNRVIMHFLDKSCFPSAAQFLFCFQKLPPSNRSISSSSSSSSSSGSGVQCHLSNHLDRRHSGCSPIPNLVATTRNNSSNIFTFFILFRRHKVWR